MKRKATWAVLLSALVILAWGCSQTGTYSGANHQSGKSVTGVDLGCGGGGQGGGGGCDSSGHGGGCDSTGNGGGCDSTGHGGGCDSTGCDGPGGGKHQMQHGGMGGDDCPMGDME